MVNLINTEHILFECKFIFWQTIRKQLWSKVVLVCQNNVIIYTSLNPCCARVQARLHNASSTGLGNLFCHGPPAKKPWFPSPSESCYSQAKLVWCCPPPQRSAPLTGISTTTRHHHHLVACHCRLKTLFTSEWARSCALFLQVYTLRYL